MKEFNSIKEAHKLRRSGKYTYQLDRMIHLSLGVCPDCKGEIKRKDVNTYTCSSDPCNE